MPGPPIRRGQAVLDALKDGKVKDEDINFCVKNILQILQRAGLLTGPGKPTHNQLNHTNVVDGQFNVSEGEKGVENSEIFQIVKEAAIGGMVLLKNEREILPLSAAKIRRLAILGPNAATPTVGGSGSASVNPYYITNPVDSITQLVAKENPNIEVHTEPGILVHKMLPVIKHSVEAPDSTPGFQMHFYHGYHCEGEIVGSLTWATSQIFIFSDGEIPSSLKNNPYSFRLNGIFTAPKFGSYQIGLSSTGKSRLFIDDVLVLDNTSWTEPGEGFMNCNSKEIKVSFTMEEGRKYHLRVDQAAVPPPLPRHDNTLFETVSGVRIGMLPPIDEEKLFEAAIEEAAAADIAVLIVGHNNDTEREGSDRTSLALPGRTEELIEAVCAVNSRTIIINQSACAVDMHRWVTRPAAIIQAWYQGQENGSALADVLFGKSSPAGKLPITFPVKLEDHPTADCFPGDVQHDHAEYKEGVLIGYRWFDQKRIKPLWPFGFGLSYSKFHITDISINNAIYDLDQHGELEILINATIQNTGMHEGSEVLQAYITSSPRLEELGLGAPLKKLAGFVKCHLLPDEKRQVDIKLGKIALEWYDVQQKGWRIDEGIYHVHIGTSSRDIIAVKQIEIVNSS